MRLTTWLSNKYEDFLFWYSDKPFANAWRGIRDRIDAAIFCLLLLAVGIYSPRTLRRIMIDAIKDTK